jgi:hypothetical protein
MVNYYFMKSFVIASEAWQSHKERNIHEKCRKKMYDIPKISGSWILTSPLKT